MKVVFWGSPVFAVSTLEAVLASGHRLTGVVTQPPRPRGRGRTPRPTPVALAAGRARLPILSPARPRGGDVLDALAALDPDVFLVAAYGSLLPPPVLALPPHGALNVHASLLPAYRGAAPVTRAILDGRRTTGVTIMRMEAGLDTGPVCLQASEPIAPADTAGTLTARLATLGARLAVEALDRLEAGALPETPQDDSRASHAAKVDPAEAELDWSRPGEHLERAVRAYDPWPGAWTRWRGERLKVFGMTPLAGEAPPAPPGTILALAPAPAVRTGDGAARLEVVQPAGGRRMPAADWAHGRTMERGERLGGNG